MADLDSGHQQPWDLVAVAPALASFLMLCCCVSLFLIVVVVIVQYVACTVSHRSVHQIEEAGDGPTWREGFRSAWSSRVRRCSCWT